MVRWDALYRRRFSLLVRGRSAESDGLSVGPAAAAAHRWRAALCRVPRRAYRSLFLVAAQSAVSGSACGGRSALHLHARTLSEAIPREICRRGAASKTD